MSELPRPSESESELISRKCFLTLGLSYDSLRLDMKEVFICLLEYTPKKSSSLPLSGYSTQEKKALNQWQDNKRHLTKTKSLSFRNANLVQ